MAKERITITVDTELLDWLDKRIDEKLFANRSHGVEFLIAQKIKEEIGSNMDLKDNKKKDDGRSDKKGDSRRT